MSTDKIATKFIVSFSVMAVCTVIILSILYTRHEKELLQQSQQEYADSLAHAVAYNAEYGVLTKNFHLLESLILGIVGDGRVRHVEIVDDQDVVVYAYGEKTGSKDTYSARAPITCSSAGAQTVTARNNAETVLFAGEGTATKATRIGEVRLTLAPDGLNKKFGMIRARIALFTILSLLCGIVVIIMLARKITAPLKTLVTATTVIADGNLAYRVPVTTADETGQLAAAFNRMTDELSRTVVSRAYVDNIIQSMTDMLIVINPDGAIRTVNRAALDALGYREDELAGKPADMIFAPDGDGTPSPAATHSHIFSYRGVSRGVEVSLLTRAGAHIPVLLSASPMVTDTGKPLGIVFTAADISERIKAEQQRNLMTERLMQSEKLTALGQLASGITHEINNPLGVILGFAHSALKNMQADDPLREPFAVIEREACRCRDIVNEMLSFARTNTFKREPGDINAVVNAALTLIESRIKNSAIQLIRDLDPALPPVPLNPVQIEQVIINLCGNAIDAMGDSGRLAVRTVLTHRQGKKYIELHCKDTGPGVPADLHRKIFEPFFTTKPEGRGTGLGLSIAYEIVQRHNGIMELESTAGHGALFRVLLPVETPA